MEPIPKINRDLELESKYNICDSNITRKENKHIRLCLIKKSKVEETVRIKIKFKMIKSFIDVCSDVR